jgi:hypothetical protein
MENIIRFGFGALLILIDQDDFTPDTAHHKSVCRRGAHKSAAYDPNFHAIFLFKLKVVATT